MTDHMARLGQRVRQRREQLGLSQEDVVERGGPSTTTQSKIETGVAASIRARTAIDLETALEWLPGSINAILAGEEPHSADVIEVRSSAGLGFRRPPKQARVWVEPAASEVDVRALNIDELAEYWAVVDFEASRAGREYARRRGLTFAAARDELYDYLRDGGMPSEDHPEADSPNVRRWSPADDGLRGLPGIIDLDQGEGLPRAARRGEHDD